MPFQIESRPQRKRPLRVVDDSNTGSAKWVSSWWLIRARYISSSLLDITCHLVVLNYKKGYIGVIMVKKCVALKHIINIL